MFNDSAGFGRIRQDSAGFGRIRQDSAGFGRIRQKFESFLVKFCSKHVLHAYVSNLEIRTHTDKSSKRFREYTKNGANRRDKLFLGG